MDPDLLHFSAVQLATAIAGVVAACLHIAVATLGFTVHRRNHSGGLWFTVMCAATAWATFWTALAPILRQLDPRWLVVSSAVSGLGGPAGLMFARVSARPAAPPHRAWLLLALPGLMYSALCLSHPPAMAYVEAFTAGRETGLHPLVSPAYAAHAVCSQGSLFAALWVAARAAWRSPPGPYRESMGWIAAAIIIGTVSLLLFTWLPGALGMVELLPLAPLATTLTAGLGYRALRLRARDLGRLSGSERDLARARLESAGLALRGVSADLRAQVQQVQTYAQLASLRSTAPPARQYYLQQLQIAADAAAELAAEATRAASADPVGARPTSLAATLDGLSTHLVDTRLPPDDPGWVRAEPAALQQAILALVDNSVQAGDPRPSIHVLRHPATVLPIEALGPAVDGAPSIELRVTDVGAGMGPEVLSSCLTPYYTTRPGRRGTGLTEVLHLVSLSGGAIALRSAPGAGTQVSLWLPTCEAPGPSAGPALPLHVPTVLLLDGDSARLDLVLQLLRSRGIRCIGWTDGEALAATDPVGTAPALVCVQRPTPGEALTIDRWTARGARVVVVGDPGIHVSGVLSLSRPERARDLVQVLVEALEAAGRG